MNEPQAVEGLDEAWAILCEARTVVLGDGLFSLQGNLYRIPSWMIDALLLTGDASKRAGAELANSFDPLTWCKPLLTEQAKAPSALRRTLNRLLRFGL